MCRYAHTYYYIQQNENMTNAYKLKSCVYIYAKNNRQSKTIFHSKLLFLLVLLSFLMDLSGGVDMRRRTKCREKGEETSQRG